MDWWTDPSEIAGLLRYLRDGDGIDVPECIDIVEKPWHWTKEYNEMCDAQRPKKGDVDR
jgi:hypothetical protein